MAITTEQLAAFKAEHPGAWAALVAAGPTASSARFQAIYPAAWAWLIAQGAAAERARIQGIEHVALPGHERLIARLKYDGETTPVQAAQLRAAAERQQLERVLGRAGLIHSSEAASSAQQISNL